jgi:adenylate kinase
MLRLFLVLFLLLVGPLWAEDEAVRMVLVGPPGAGKGTQARVLADRFKLAHISTGDILREQVRLETPLGKQAKEYMNSGRLVPDDLIISMVQEKLAGTNGFILDGFPRSEVQAQKLDESLEKLGRPLNVVILLDVPDEELVSRLSQRRACPKCQRSYHLSANPPKQAGVCDMDGTPLVQREDDKEETIRKRLQVYHNQTEPIINYYRRNVGVAEIDGRQHIDKVGQDAIHVVEDRVGAGVP